MPRPQPSYAWALNAEDAGLSLSALSPKARRGFEYARALARDAQARRACAPGWKEHQPLTTRDIAARQDLSEPSVRRYISRARRELFGELGASAVYKLCRVKRDREVRFW